MRAGLTGLGIVFLSTLAASLVFGPSADDPATQEHVKAPGEPLAQLGVAPGLEKTTEGEPVLPDPAPESADPALADPALADPALADPPPAAPPAARPMDGNIVFGPACRPAAV